MPCQGSKWHSLVAEHARALHLNHHLTKEKVAKHRSVHLVVLFSDMCDFTARSAGQSTQALAAQLTPQCVAELVSHEGGILDKFLGDGLESSKLSCMTIGYNDKMLNRPRGWLARCTSVTRRSQALNLRAL